MSTAVIEGATVHVRERRAWRDAKRYLWLLGLVQLTGLGAMGFFGPVLVFVIFPLADLAVGLDRTNPPDEAIKRLEADRYYRWCTYAFLPIQYAGLVFACWQWSSGKLGLVESVGLALTMAMVSGIAINTAH